MITRDYSTTDDTHTYTYGIVREKGFTTPHGSYDAFDYTGDSTFVATHVVIVDKSNDSETNDALIAKAIAA